MSRADAFRNRNNRIIKLPDGCEILYRTPSAFDLIESDLSPVLGDVTLDEVSYKKKLEEVVNDLNKDLKKVIPIAERLFARVFIDPRFHAGEGEPPPGAITSSMLGADLIDVMNQVLNATGSGVGEAAQAAARFRDDANGDAGEPDSAALRGAADGDSRPRAPEFPPAPRDGFSGIGGQRPASAANPSAE